MASLRFPDADELAERLDDLRRRIRRAAWIEGTARVGATLLAAVVVLACLDRWLHLPATVRALALALLLGLAVAGLIRWLLQPLRQPTDDLALALRIERRFPLLRDRLASAVEFLRSPADAPGSREMRRLSVEMALRRADGFDFRSVHDAGPSRRALGKFAAVLLLAGLMLAIVPAGLIAAALARLADPFGAHPWPPQTQLVVTAPVWPGDGQPLRMPLGEPFELQARLSGVVPARAEAQFRLAEKGAVVATTVLISDDGELVVRLEPSRATRPFQVRITANDADTGWLSVDVRPPPLLTPLDGRPSPQLQVIPPAYTGLTPADAPDGTGAIELPAGSTVRIRAATDRPLAQASVGLHRGHHEAIVTALALAPLAARDPLSAALSTAWNRLAEPTPATLTDDRLGLSVQFEPRISGTYSLAVVDQDGMAGGRLLDIKVVADPAPTVRLDRPSPARENLGVVPEAELPLEISVEDELYGVRDVWLEYRFDRDQPPLRRLLNPRLPPALRLVLAAPGGWPALMSAPIQVPQHGLMVARPLLIAELVHADGTPPREGDTILLQTHADDFDDVTPGKGSGRSVEIELRIVAGSELEVRVQQQVAEIRQELLQARQQQAQAATATKEAAEGLKREGRLTPDNTSRLVQAEQAQQQVRARLGNRETGLQGRVERLRESLRENRMPRTGSTDRLDAVATELDRLAREELPPVEPLLARARKGEPPPERADPLARAQQHQREIERTIAGLLDQLEPWSGAAEARGEARELLRDQQDLMRQTDRLEQAVDQGITPDNLPPEQKQELERAAERQERLAAKAGLLFEKLNRLADEKREQAEARQQQAAAAEQAAANGTERQARARQAEARDRQDEAARLQREAAALSAAAQAARDNEEKGQAGAALSQAARNLRENQTGQARTQQERAARALEDVAAALEEKSSPDDLDRLAKRLKAARQDLADLTAAQEQLQRRVEAAGQIADPKERGEELERLRREQETLREETREMVERLSRMRSGDAARSLSRAGRQMDRAGERMQADEPAEETQDEALDRLDDAAAELEQAERDLEERLLREQRAKLRNLVSNLRDRQQAAVKELERLIGRAAEPAGWTRSVKSELSGLASTQSTLSEDTVQLADDKFEPLPVFRQLSRRSAEAMDHAVDLLRQQIRPAATAPPQDGTALALEWQRLALRRMTQLLDALEEPKDESSRQRASDGQRPPRDGDADSSTAGSRDGVPAKAQLQALRALQAELIERTATFAKTHPEGAKSTPADQLELQILREAQADVAVLVEQLTALSGEQP